MHSGLSHDSRGTVEEIVAAAKATGTRVLLFTEHPADHYDFYKDGHRGLKDGVLLIPGAVAPVGVADMLGMLGTPGGQAPIRLAAAAMAEPVPSKIVTEGTGKGEIIDAQVAGQPAAEPITLELHPVPGGFRFGNQQQEGRRGPSVPTTPAGDQAPLSLTKWLIVVIASIGFAFDIYELLMLPLVIRPALLELGRQVRS